MRGTLRILKTALWFLLQFTWGIVQNAAGLFIFLFLVMFGGRRPTVFRLSAVTPWRPEGCMSLGVFIFLGSCARGPDDPLVIHEYGHSVQSVLLGPLYLPIIGIPSLIWAATSRSRRRRSRKPGRPQEKGRATGQRSKTKKRRRKNYTEFYTEKWANRLGRKVTGRRPPEW